MTPARPTPTLQRFCVGRPATKPPPRRPPSSSRGSTKYAPKYSRRGKRGGGGGGGGGLFLASTSSSSSSSSSSLSQQQQQQEKAAAQRRIRDFNKEERGKDISRIARDFRRSSALLRKKNEEEKKKEEEILLVRAIREKDVKDASKVFRDSFEGSPDEKPRGFVLRYLLEACVLDEEDVDDDDDDDAKNAHETTTAANKKNPYEVCFVGVTTKTNEETGETVEDEVISLVSVALDVRSRIVDDPNPPPSDAPYVCNMAVSARHRNKGVAKAMLEAIGEFVPSVGGCDVWLHVRELDEKAVRVYERFGFETVKADEKNPLLNLVLNRKESRKGRILMRKVLAEGCNFIL